MSPEGARKSRRSAWFAGGQNHAEITGGGRSRRHSIAVALALLAFIGRTIGHCNGRVLTASLHGFLQKRGSMQRFDKPFTAWVPVIARGSTDPHWRELTLVE